MVDEWTLVVWADMQAQNEGGCGDPGYGWYEEATPVVLKALGDDPDEVAEFIMTTSPELQNFLGDYCDEIYDKFHTKAVYEALLTIIDYPEELEPPDDDE